MGDDLVMKLNALADARHDDLEDDDLDIAAQAAQRIISVTLQLMDANERIAALERTQIGEDVVEKIEDWLDHTIYGGDELFEATIIFRNILATVTQGERDE